MSVYLNGGSVLLDGSGNVATSADCCCGGCCPIPTLVCDSVSATKTKCGYSPQLISGDYFRHWESTLTGEVGTDSVPSTNLYRTVNTTFAVPTGAIGSPILVTEACENPSGICLCESGAGYRTDCSGSFTQTGFLFECDPPCLFATSAFSREGESFGTCVDVSLMATVGDIADLTDLYTTDILVANAIAALPAYSDCFGCDGCVYPAGEGCLCTASRDLTEDEVTVSIRRFKYKFTWDTPLAETCAISWIERTYDEDGNPVSDMTMSETVAAGETESTVHEALEPDDNGTVGVVFPIGGCCTAGVCTTTDEATCVSGGGTYQGDGCVENGCSPDPC